MEFFPLLQRLQDGYSPSTLPYHVIVPSLPGFCFSDSPPLTRDFNLSDVSAIIDKLMIDLGFGGGYVAQGGDLGSKIGRILGAKYAACKGLYSCILVFFNFNYSKSLDTSGGSRHLYYFC